MTRYNLIFVLLFTLTLLVGCQETPDIIVNVPPPTVIIQEGDDVDIADEDPDGDPVTTGDDDDSAGDDDDSAEPGDDDDSTESPCAAKLILSDLGNGAAYCQGSLTATEVFADGTLVQHFLLDALYYTSQGQRYFIPHGMVMESWYGDDCTVCNDVVQSGTALTNLMLMGTVTIKPGSFIVTLPNDPQLWVVDTCHTLRAVTPSMAQAIYGPSWNDLIRIMPEMYFVDYMIGFPVMNVTDYNPNAASSIVDEIVCSP